MHLYERYKGRVQFVVVDLDRSRSATQKELQKKFYRGYIPHIAILDNAGQAAYDSAGEVEESTLEMILDKTLK